MALALTIAAAPRPARADSGTEVNVVPLLGGDSDIGVGGGVIGDWAALAPGRPPVRWRLEAASLTTFKDHNGSVVLPYTDNYLELLVPGTGPGGRLHMDARLSFTDERTLTYQGLGNASPRRPAGLPIDSTEYQRLHPTASLEVRTRLVGSLYLLGGTAYTYNRVAVPAGTILADERAMGPPEVRAILIGFEPHGVELLTVEAQLDTRDDEIVTHTGQFHTFRFRVSPHLGSALPYGYERLTLTTRFYRSPFGHWLTLRGRIVGDLLMGSPPFYELMRYDETSAIGGINGVRGVPAQRYYGKVKLFGNLEAASALWSFSVRSKHLIVGPAVFYDAGRVWTEISRKHPELDGTGIGLKYGVGGGLRVQEGRTFVLRLDVAWSPDATPIGAYFGAGDVF